MSAALKKEILGKREKSTREERVTEVGGDYSAPLNAVTAGLHLLRTLEKKAAAGYKLSQAILEAERAALHAQVMQGTVQLNSYIDHKVVNEYKAETIPACSLVTRKA